MSIDYSSLKKRLIGIPLIVRYGLILAVGLILLKTLEYQFFSFRISIEIYSGLLALCFTLVGLAMGFLWLKRYNKDKPVAPPELSEALSAKELKLLRGLEEGLSNQQLADSFFVSINTIKTQLKTLYRKLGVSKRADAVDKGKSLLLL